MISVLFLQYHPNWQKCNYANDNQLLLGSTIVRVSHLQFDDESQDSYYHIWSCMEIKQSILPYLIMDTKLKIFGFLTNSNKTIVTNLIHFLWPYVKRHFKICNKNKTNLPFLLFCWVRFLFWTCPAQHQLTAIE